MSTSLRSRTNTPKSDIRDVLTLPSANFDINTVPADVRRVYDFLADKYDEEYALLFVFSMRTAEELHRAWHMTLLTNQILQQIKEKFNLTMTWNLGVIRLKFRVEDGGYELHRKVPYDYDSEYQDIYLRIALALIEGQIDVVEALNYQKETKEGLHTAKSGLFLRTFPGRLILYPFEAATCAVIFFKGDWTDMWIAAICGLAAGCVEYFLGFISGELRKGQVKRVQASVLTDAFVGLSTGIIGGLFYAYTEYEPCLSSIFLGTLYWFFYGTAFVIGLLEIIAGELETGVTRFIAVAVKTFVLSLGASIGLMFVAQGGAREAWYGSDANYCNEGFVDGVWWRVPMYLLCSVSVLGQYRAPILQYWRGLIVMLCAYEAQYRLSNHLGSTHKLDELDTAASNIVGAIAGVLSACTVSSIVNHIRNSYDSRLLLKDNGKSSKCGDCIFAIMKVGVKLGACFGLARENDKLKISLMQKLKIEKKELDDPTHCRQEIVGTAKDHNVLTEIVIGKQPFNVWAILMPAVYQLVPGSIIAKLWFEMIFPPEGDVAGVLSNLMVISTSLAIGVIVGFVIVQIFDTTFFCFSCGGTGVESEGARLIQGMCAVQEATEDDPDDDFVQGDDNDAGGTYLRQSMGVGQKLSGDEENAVVESSVEEKVVSPIITPNSVEVPLTIGKEGSLKSGQSSFLDCW